MSKHTVAPKLAQAAAPLLHTSIEVETFAGRWPAVLVEMKDFIDLWFLAKKHQVATVRIFISRALVPQAQLQPHMREFRASFGAIAACRIELKGTEARAHKIEIEYRRGTA